MRGADFACSSVAARLLGSGGLRLRLLLAVTGAPVPFAPAVVAPAIVAVVTVAAALGAATARRESALGLLQLGPRPLAVQVVLLDVVLRLRPYGDALVEFHHEEPHRFALRPLQQLGDFGMAGDDDLVLALLARGALHFAHDFVRHRRLAAHVAPPVAGGAGLGGEPRDALAHAL